MLVERRLFDDRSWLRIFRQLVKDVRAHSKALQDPREPRAWNQSHEGDEGLDPREPLIWAYATLLGMPGKLRQDYKGLRESGGVAGLTDSHDRLRDGGYLFTELDTAPSCRLEWLARLVRTLDADLAGFHFGPVEGERWTPDAWVVPGYPCSVVPVDRTHRAEEGKPFERRGLAQHAVIPTRIGDVAIRLHLHSAVEPQARRRSPLRRLTFGSALVPDLTVDVAHEGEGFFVSGLRGADLAAAMRNHVAEATATGCDVVLWAELCATTGEVDGLADHLGDTAVAHPGRPSLLVPASWHSIDGGGARRNRLTAMDGFGEKVVDHYDKRHKFMFGDRLEAIEPGPAISILVMEDRLVAFGICLDFCDDVPPRLYEQLDVDLIIVPSMGLRSTMASHLRHMPTQHAVHAAEVVVVQQVPVVTGSPRAEGEPLGYAALSPISVGGEDPSKHRQDEAFAVLGGGSGSRQQDPTNEL